MRPLHPEYRKLLLPYGGVIQQLALAARKLILEEAPEASEFVYEVYTIADHFTFTERPSDAFVFTTTHANWVNLGFNFGSTLPDPEGLLQGNGKWIRHVRIATDDRSGGAWCSTVAKSGYLTSRAAPNQSHEAEYYDTQGSIRREAV